MAKFYWSPLHEGYGLAALSSPERFKDGDEGCRLRRVPPSGLTSSIPSARMRRVGLRGERLIDGSSPCTGV